MAVENAKSPMLSNKFEDFAIAVNCFSACLCQHLCEVALLVAIQGHVP